MATFWEKVGELLIKSHQVMKSMRRKEIAYHAGVTVRTLTNWCKPYQKDLEELGLKRNMIELPPSIVEWICHKFCIDIDED